MRKNFINIYAAMCLEKGIVVLDVNHIFPVCHIPPVVDPDAAAVTRGWGYIRELIFKMLVNVGAVKMSDRVVRELMEL